MSTEPTPKTFQRGGNYYRSLHLVVLIDPTKTPAVVKRAFISSTPAHQLSYHGDGCGYATVFDGETCATEDEADEAFVRAMASSYPFYGWALKLIPDCDGKKAPMVVEIQRRWVAFMAERGFKGEP